MTEPDLTFLDTSSLLICTLRGHSSWSSSSSIVATESSSQDPVSYQCNYFLNAIDKTEEVMEEINKVLNQSSKQSADGIGDEKLRRQGLNRLSKRSRFSFKQSLSPNQNTIIEKPSTHIAEDPEEYFAAIKRNENAEMELKKLRGEDHKRDEVKRTDRQRRPGLTKKRTSLNHFRKGIDLEALKSPNTKEYGSPRKDTNLSKNKSQTEEISVCQQYNAIEEEASKEKTGGCLEKWFSDMKWLYEREDASAILEAFDVKPIVVDEIRLPITPDTSPDHSPIAKTTISFSTNLLDAVGRNKVVDPFLSGDNETVDDAGINDTSAHKKGFSPKPPRSPSFRDSNTSITPKKTDNKLISDDKIIPDAHPISPGMKNLCLKKNLPPRSPYSRVSHVNEMVSDINDTPTRLKKSSLTGILKPPRSPSLGVSNTSTSCRKAGGKLLLDSHKTLAEKGDDLPQHILIQNQLVESPTHHKTFNHNEGKALQSLDIMDIVDDILTNVGGTDCIKDRLGEVTEVLHEETEKSESARGQSSAAMDTTVVPARHQGDDLPRHILIQNQPAQSPLHCETTNTAEEVPQSLDSLGAVDDILNNVGDTNSIKDRLGEVLHEETEQSENFRGQLSASMDMTVVPTGHQESSSILAEPHIEIETRVPKKRGRPKVGKEMSKIKSLAGGTASVSGVLLEHWHEETEQSKSVRGQSNASMGTTVVADGHQESSSILAERHIETETKVPKKRDCPKLVKENSKRKSLEVETAFVSGVRRSTRMKFRPLEHWRGEKLLFGRLDKDLPTLLGVKCFTPHGRTKVKLCVSEEHTKHLPSAAFN